MGQEITPMLCTLRSFVRSPGDVIFFSMCAIENFFPINVDLSDFRLSVLSDNIMVVASQVLCM